MLDMGANDFKRDEGRKEEKIMNTVKEVSLPLVIKAHPQLFPSIALKILSPWEERSRKTEAAAQPKAAESQVNGRSLTQLELVLVK